MKIELTEVERDIMAPFVEAMDTAEHGLRSVISIHKEMSKKLFNEINALFFDYRVIEFRHPKEGAWEVIVRDINGDRIKQKAVYVDDEVGTDDPELQLSHTLADELKEGVEKLEKEGEGL